MPEQSLADDPRLDSILRGVEIFKATRETVKPRLIDHPELSSILRGVEICRQRESQREDLAGRKAREFGVAPKDLYERFRREKKHPSSNRFKRALAGAGLAALAGLASLSAGSPVRSHDQPVDASLGYSVSDTVRPPEPALEKPTNLTESLMKPFLEEAMKKRSERAKSDPEYSHRVERELNQDRVNFLLYGYGETLENPPENPSMEKGNMGSHSILSYNLKTKTWDVVSLTHDILAPEIETYLKAHGRKSTPTKLNGAYHIGGFPLQRVTLENATGLSVDFQIALKDTFIKDFVEKVFGELEIDVPFDLQTYPFYQDGRLFEEGQFEKGKQKMDSLRVMQFIKAWSKSHSPQHERNVRKHIIFKALLKQAKQNMMNPDFLLKAISYLKQQSDQKGLEVDFNLLGILAKPDLMINILRSIASGQEQQTEMEIGKTMYVVDPYAGGDEGGVSWITRSNSPHIQEIFAAKVVTDTTIAVPASPNANPQSEDLVTDYWKSVRELVKRRLSE